MSAFPVSEEELHAYLDGQLEPRRQVEVRAFLEASPVAAARLASWRRDAEGLRAALAGIETWPPNPSLDPAVIRRRMRNRTLQAVARATVLTAALGLAGLLGWSLRGSYVGPAARPMQDALDAYRAFAARRLHAVEQASAERLPSWLAATLGAGHPPVLPDLRSQGFRPLGGRLLATSEGVGAMILYEADGGVRISFYLRPARHFIPGTHGWREDGGLRARYWYEGGYGYAVVGRADDPRTWEIERSFPSAL
jgi:anti-sigma factor RsiW